MSKSKATLAEEQLERIEPQEFSHEIENAIQFQSGPAFWQHTALHGQCLPHRRHFQLDGHTRRLPAQDIVLGFLGALVMRAALIAAGVAVVTRFDWVLYVFGAFLIITGVRLFRQGGEPSHPERNPFVRLARRALPIAEQEAQTPKPSFFVRRGGKLLATPLFLAIVMVESTDLVLALDSIPAIFGVTHDPFIVYTSNVFALMGLRALYFVVAGALSRLRYLRIGLSAILVFMGLKMLVGHFYKLPVWLSLIVICAIAIISVVASLRDQAAHKAGSRCFRATALDPDRVQPPCPMQRD